MHWLSLFFYFEAKFGSLEKRISKRLISIEINLLKPTAYVMHQQFNIQQLYVLSTLYLFCIYLRTNSGLCHLQHKLIGFYNWDEKCLLRGTNWVFKYGLGL